MNVRHSDGRLFENTEEDDFQGDYEPGDVAWFEEDVLLVVAVKDGEAQAIEHPAARDMLDAALNFGPPGPKGGAIGIAETMRIHARTMARGWLAAREMGLVGSGRVGNDLRMFDFGDEQVIAADKADSLMVLREHRGNEPDEAEEPREVAGATSHTITFHEPVEKTAAEWCALHGRGWLSGDY